MQEYLTIDEVARYLEVEKKDVLERLKENLLSPSIYYSGEIEVVEVGGDGKPIRITGLMGIDGIRGLYWADSQVKGVNLIIQVEDSEPLKIIRMTENDALCRRSWEKSCVDGVTVFTQFEEDEPSKTVAGELLLPEQETLRRCRQYIPHSEFSERCPSPGIEELAFDFSQVMVGVDSLIAYMLKQGRDIPVELKYLPSPEEYIETWRGKMPNPDLAKQAYKIGKEQEKKGNKGITEERLGEIFRNEGEKDTINANQQRGHRLLL